MIKKYWSERGHVRYNTDLEKAHVCTGKYALSVWVEGCGFSVKLAFYGDIQTYHMEGMPLDTVAVLLADVEGQLPLANRFYGVR